MESFVSSSPPSSQKPRRRYRPAKNYPHQFSVRVTTGEGEILRKAAREAGLSVSRYLTRTATERRFPPTLLDREALFRTRFLLEKAGTNLNQIAHRMNAFAKGAPVAMPTLEEVQQAARMVKAVVREVKRRL